MAKLNLVVSYLQDSTSSKSSFLEMKIYVFVLLIVVAVAFALPTNGME